MTPGRARRAIPVIATGRSTPSPPVTTVEGDETIPAVLPEVPLAFLSFGSISGVLIGAHFSNKTPETWLREVIAGVLSLVGLKLIAA